MSDDDSRILFNSGTSQWALLSNFSPHPIGPFPTAEHLYQAMKTTVPEEREMIRRVASPKQAKALSYKFTLRPDWTEAFKLSVMQEIIRRKFSRPGLRQLLLLTDTRQLVHFAPWGDTFWGENKEGQGENWQGKLIMRVREEIGLRWSRFEGWNPDCSVCVNDSTIPHEHKEQWREWPSEERGEGEAAVEAALRAYPSPGPQPPTL